MCQLRAAVLARLSFDMSSGSQGRLLPVLRYLPILSEVCTTIQHRNWHVALHVYVERFPERNLSNLQVGGMKTECMDHSCDLTSDVNVEDTSVPFSFAVVKCEVEDIPMPISSAVLKSEVDQDLCHLNRVQEEQKMEASSEEDEVFSERKEKKSDDESRKYEREKIRRQRANMTEEELQKTMAKNIKKRKKIADMTDREKRNVRRQVKSDVQKFRGYLKQWASTMHTTEILDSVIKLTTTQKREIIDNDYKTGSITIVAYIVNALNSSIVDNVEKNLSQECASIDLAEHKLTQCGSSRPESSNIMDIRRTSIKCNEVFVTQQPMKLHFHIHPRNKSFKCNVCGKCFSDSANLNKHALIHTRERPFKCEVCGKCFSQLGHLNEHLRIHTRERPFKCEVCEKCFSQIGHLKRHVRIHTDEVPLKCDVCGRCFSESAVLSLHARIHTGEVPFKCDVCGKCFSQLGQLNRHVRIHTGDRPFICEVCEKCFPESAALRRHARLHTGERPFKCEVCGKCFTQSTALSRHVRIHSGERPFKCNMCGKCFSQFEHLKRHLHIHTAKKHSNATPMETVFHKTDISTILPSSTQPRDH
ncbi:hypothetical protein ANN_27848 [Periplaneta americana]|uniref:C2H2-type domain-containing protein n=1 Tax=Periplaneta americana TaxID=6978 RepID=A0ABQ8RVA7_PERAM|nr:hypothetical protein ANN_27848 [Periplaneta americana]